MNQNSSNKFSFSALFTRFRELGMVLFIIVLIVLIQIRNSNFLSLENIDDLLVNTAILSILALGMMMVIITRGIDLSIGATLALSGMITALTVSANQGMHPVAAVLLGTGVGLIAGLIIGMLIAKLKILPIIASLGMMNVYRGLTFIVSDGAWVSAYQMPDSFVNIATSYFLGVSTLIWIAIILNVIVYYFLNHTRLGRKVYAVGSNPESALVSGINTALIIIMVYTVMGALAGLSGVLWVSKFASAQGDTASGYELTVIAACVLGGVSMAGGVGKVSGVIIGSLLLGILQNALPLVNISAFWQQGIQGTIILIAVLSNVMIKRNADRKNLARREI